MIARSARARRNDVDICADILGVAERGARKTRIVYRANLNFDIVKKYLERLIESDLIRRTDDLHYETTEKGVKFLEGYRELLAPDMRYGNNF